MCGKDAQMFHGWEATPIGLYSSVAPGESKPRLSQTVTGVGYHESAAGASEAAGASLEAGADDAGLSSAAWLDVDSAELDPPHAARTSARLAMPATPHVVFIFISTPHIPSVPERSHVSR